MSVWTRLPKVTERRFHWAKQVRPFPRATFIEPGEPVVVAEGSWTVAEGPAAYDDGGRYVVLEVLDGLEWIVADTQHQLRSERIMLDFHEACTRAHDLNRADERYGDTPPVHQD